MNYHIQLKNYSLGIKQQSVILQTRPHTNIETTTIFNKYFIVLFQCKKDADKKIDKQSIHYNRTLFIAIKQKITIEYHVFLYILKI